MSGHEANEPLGQTVLAGLLRGTLRIFLKRRNRAGRPIDDQRRWLEKLTRIALVPGSVKFSPGRVGAVPGEWVDTKNPGSTGRTILYLHGGAYCVGSPRTHRALTGNMGIRCAARVFVADYRLAPEHPFPAAIEDAIAAYRGLLESGVAANDIVIAGDSAGGGLALATAARLRDLGVPLPSHLIVFSPWADLTAGAPGTESPAEAMLNRDWLDECAAFYAGETRRDDPGVSPVYADLGGLPPTLVQVGSDELILTDSLRVTERIEACGGRVRLSVFARRWHVFQLHAGVLADADRALDEVAAFLEPRR